MLPLILVPYIRSDPQVAAVLALAFPTMLMGGTLPVLTAFVASSR